MTNPLLAIHGLPAFDQIRPEHVEPAIDVLLKDADAALEHAVGPDVAADYEALSAALDVPSERLKTAWGAVGHLNAVADTPELHGRVSGAFFLAAGSVDQDMHSRTAMLTPPQCWMGWCWTVCR